MQNSHLDDTYRRVAVYGNAVQQ